MSAIAESECHVKKTLKMKIYLTSVLVNKTVSSFSGKKQQELKGQVRRDGDFHIPKSCLSHCLPDASVCLSFNLSEFC